MPCLFLNPDVIGELEFSLQPGVVSGWPGTYPCIEFGYKALKAGTTNVSLKFFYKFDSRSGLSGWYYDLVTFTVNVSATEVQKPDKPTVSDVERFRNYVNSTSSSKGAVYMWCDTYDHHAWFSYITDVDDAYTLGEVVANDGTVLSKGTYPWVCVMTLDANKYLDAYNSECREYGTHYLKDGQAATETATWYWNAALSKWQFRSSEAPIYINITHDKPVTEETYVLHYDANGGEGAPASQTTKSNTGKATFTVSSAIPTRDGYTFLGWADDADATAVQYHGGDKITLTKDNPTKTIYAVWEENPPLDIPNPNPGNIAENLKVKVVCTTPNSGHEPAFYSLIDGTFTHTDVDQSGDYPTCSITISPDEYISQYSTDKNCQHTTPDDPKTVPLFWNKEAQKWAVNDDQIGLNGVVFNAVCEAVPVGPTNTTVRVYVKLVDTDGNDVNAMEFKSTDFGPGIRNNHYAVGSLTTTQTLADATADPEGSGLEDTDPVKTFVYQQMARGDDSWTPADGVAQEFTWARQIRFTELKKQDDGTYNLYGQIIAYKLELDAKGGTMDNDPSGYYLTGSNITFPVPTKSGYAFLGWTKQDLSGDGGVIVMSNDENEMQPIEQPQSTELIMDETWEANWKATRPTRPAISARQEYVRVQCVNDKAEHEYQSMHYSPNIYTNCTEVKDDDGNAVRLVNGTWTYTVVLNRAAFVEKFNAKYEGHEDLEPNEETTMSWVWNGAEWNLVPVNGLRTVGAIIEVTCEPKAPTADELKKA